MFSKSREVYISNSDFALRTLVRGGRKLSGKKLE